MTEHRMSSAAARSLPQALEGVGVLDGLVVRCESPAWALRFHTGYEPRESDRHDMELLCEKFGMELPQALR